MELSEVKKSFLHNKDALLVGYLTHSSQPFRPNVMEQIIIDSSTRVYIFIFAGRCVYIME